MWVGFLTTLFRAREPTSVEVETRLEEGGQDGAQGVVVLHVGSLVASATPMSADDLARLAAAEAVLVDLRRAEGSDVRAIWPAIETVVGRGALRPVRAIHHATGAEVEASRRRFAAVFGERPSFDADALAPLRGEALPDNTPVYDGSAKVVVALAGDVCGRGCDLVARMLDHYGAAPFITSTRYSGGNLAPRAAPGLFELQSIGVRLTFPTVRIELEGQSVVWSTGNETDAREVLKTHLRWNRTFARHHNSPPSPCASFAPVPEGDETPLGPSSRADLIDGISEYALVEIELPPEAAQAYVRGCPGLSTREVPLSPSRSLFAPERYGTRFVVHGTTYDLSRLAQSPVLITMRREPAATEAHDS